MEKPLQVVVKMAQLGFGKCEAVATQGTVKSNDSTALYKGKSDLRRN